MNSAPTVEAHAGCTPAGRTMAAPVLNAATAAYLLLAPTYSGSELYEDTIGLTHEIQSRSTLIAVNGLSALVPVLVPVAVCGRLAYNLTRFARAARVAGKSHPQWLRSSCRLLDRPALPAQCVGHDFGGVDK